MEDILTNLHETETFTDKEIFTKIWTSPRKIFRFINDVRYEKHVTLLLALAGMSNAFNRASTKHMGDSMSIWALVGLCIVLGGLLGWISYYIYAALVSWTGKWLKGQGDTTSLLRMLAYSLIPSLFSLVLLIPELIFYADEFFKSESYLGESGLLYNIGFYTLTGLELILTIWTLVLAVVGTSEVQKLSIGMAILNLVLPILIIFVPLMLLVVLLGGF